MLIITLSKNSFAYSILEIDNKLAKWHQEETYVCVLDDTQTLLPIVETSYQPWLVPNTTVPKINFIYCNDVNLTDNSQLNLILFTDLPDDFLGFTIVHTSDDQITRCKILLNQNVNWQEYNLQNVLTHEFGHFLGFTHETNTDSIMYPYTHNSDKLLSDDDILGVRHLYPPDNGCNFSGANTNWLIILVSLVLIRLRRI